jgi:ankyrin repeat protein
MAAANGHIEIVKFLIENFKCDLNIQNYAGNTPLRIKIYKT